MVGFGPPANRQARREWWRRQIQRQHDGSRTVAEFCRRLGVSTVTSRGPIGRPGETRHVRPPAALPHSPLLVWTAPSSRPAIERGFRRRTYRPSSRRRFRTAAATRFISVGSGFSSRKGILCFRTGRVISPDPSSIMRPSVGAGRFRPMTLNPPPPDEFRGRRIRHPASSNLADYQMQTSTQASPRKRSSSSATRRSSTGGRSGSSGS
jgi:hypothetical protein